MCKTEMVVVNLVTNESHLQICGNFFLCLFWYFFNSFCFFFFILHSFNDRKMTVCLVTPVNALFQMLTLRSVIDSRKEKFNLIFYSSRCVLMCLYIKDWKFWNFSFRKRRLVWFGLDHLFSWKIVLIHFHLEFCIQRRS